MLLQTPANNDRPVVAADLEGTLTAGTTWHGLRDYLRIIGDERSFRRFFWRRLPGILLFRLRLGDRQAFKYEWIRDMWALYEGRTLAEIEELAEWVVAEVLWPARRNAVLAELSAYADDGYRVVVISGVAEPIMQAFLSLVAAQGPLLEGIGTPLQMARKTGVGEVFTGRFAAEINIGTRKAVRLQPFARDGQIEAAYGDTEPDIPMLAMSHHPVAVAPDVGLRQAATERGWRIMEDGT